VLQGVLEEKSSRVVEVIVSAATPFELMIGKLLGIGAAALTQFGLWLACIVALTAPGLIASMVAMPEGFGIPTISIVQALYVLVFFVLGFFVYSTMYAAVGAAFNSVQEAQQLATIPTFAIISPLLFLLPVLNDPAGALAVVTSMVPIMSPILMPLRIAIEMPPAWQVWLSIAITAAFVWLMIGVCARIYRVGILMYGKKPTVQELWRWLRYA
jgi:ABC-2 type transport system permease protein